jgi:hypothetical protein
VPKKSKLYLMSSMELTALDTTLKEHLDSGWIHQSDSPQMAGFFFRDKKDGKLRPIQDYRYLNKHTKKDVYLILLISDTFDNFGKAKYFTKLDVQIKEGDEWKAAFLTP